MSVLVGHEVLLVPEQFATIQLAVDSAAGPTTIVVAPGLYAESINVVDRPYLVIQSARLSKRGVTLVGGSGDIAVVSVERSHLHLSGLEIRSNARLRGVIATNASLNLQECVIAGNRTTETRNPFGAGILAVGADVHIQKSALIGNVVDCPTSSVAGGGGLYLLSCRIEIAGSTIQGNAVYAPAALRGGGIWCEHSSMRMWRSRVTDNALYGGFCRGAGIYFHDTPNAQLGGSVITGNSCHVGSGGGIFISGDGARIHVHRNSVVRQNHPTDLDCISLEVSAGLAGAGSA